MTPETGAHLTNVVKPSPSLFEILSQENLSTSVHHAFQYVTKVIASGHPEKLAWLYCRNEEIYLLLNAFIQSHYLKTRGATLSEAFYGLQRIPVRHNISLILEVILPYLQTKVGKWIEEREDPDPNRLRTWHNLTGILNFLKFYYYIAYILEKSTTHSLLFKLFGWKLVYSQNQEPVVNNLTSWRSSFIFNLCESVLPTIEFISFLIQFLNWWKLERKQNVDIIIPEPYESGFQFGNGCPICGQRIRNCTALRTSGIVYCYGCISKYLSQIHKCPISGIPSSTNDLVRIYE